MVPDSIPLPPSPCSQVTEGDRGWPCTALPRLKGVARRGTGTFPPRQLFLPLPQLPPGPLPPGSSPAPAAKVSALLRSGNWTEATKRSQGSAGSRLAVSPPGHLPPAGVLPAASGLSQRRLLEHLPATEPPSGQVGGRTDLSKEKKEKVLREEGAGGGSLVQAAAVSSRHLDLLGSKVSLARSGNAVSRK